MNNSAPTDTLQILEHRTFFLNTQCSPEIASLISAEADFTSNTRLAQKSHIWTVKIEKWRTTLNQKFVFY